MNIKIVGEFETIDFAEICANRIRHTCSGIKKAVVRCKRVGNYSSYSPVILSPTAAYASGNFSGALVPLEHAHAYETEVDERRSAELEIVADESSYHKISALFSAYGGTNVRRV